MALIDLYPAIKVVHVAMVGTSGLLFAFRGAAVIAGRPWAMAKPWRMASYAIDTVLAGAGVTLWVMLSLDPVGASAWLGVKLALLLVYIVLGSFALKRGRTREVRATCYVAALLVYAFMASVALRHAVPGVFA